MSEFAPLGSLGKDLSAISDSDQIASPLEISVVIPVFNERENLKPLYWSLKKVLESLELRYEILFIDDGSVDGSLALLQQLSQSDQRVRVIEFVRNFGQTAAIAAGFEHARGAVIIPMDADLQNDPLDIPKIINKLREGYDVVCCWRKNRKDRWFRVLLSRAANRLISWISGVRLHDYGCTLKAYRHNVVRHIRLYGETRGEHSGQPVRSHRSGTGVRSKLWSDCSHLCRLQPCQRTDHHSPGCRFTE